MYLNVRFSYPSYLSPWFIKIIRLLPSNCNCIFEYSDWESFYSPKSHSSITDRARAFDTKVHSIIYRRAGGGKGGKVGSREATRWKIEEWEIGRWFSTFDAIIHLTFRWDGKAIVARYHPRLRDCASDLYYGDFIRVCPTLISSICLRFASK